MSMDYAIEFEGVFKGFTDRQVLRGIDLQVPRGETMVILGSSGSGKSVLVSTVVGLLRPDQGRVLVSGENVAEFASEDQWRKVWLKTGFLFQGAALFDSMTVGENIAFPLRQHTALSEAAIVDRVMEVLSWIELDGAFDKMPSELSGGMQKRVGLGRTIVLEPEIVIYDEPTTGLDPLTSDTISSLILRLKSERAVTSIVVTHDVRCAFQVADRAAMIDEGVILAEGTLEEIRNSSVPKLRSFLYG
ncbi:MAG: ABC transporter ATP-binding protein [Candidatus Binatia bacterium]|nr:ABC transporter ATP-binding protein [Candidatus Binatia bacterium]MDG2009145.1 ABC transporter ATP-binding protein [Candidatus Binatia bacterium]